MNLFNSYIRSYMNLCNSLASFNWFIYELYVHKWTCVIHIYVHIWTYVIHNSTIFNLFVYELYVHTWTCVIHIWIYLSSICKVNENTLLSTTAYARNFSVLHDQSRNFWQMSSGDYFYTYTIFSTSGLNLSSEIHLGLHAIWFEVYYSDMGSRVTKLFSWDQWDHKITLETSQQKTFTMFLLWRFKFLFTFTVPPCEVLGVILWCYQSHKNMLISHELNLYYSTN